MKLKLILLNLLFFSIFNNSIATKIYYLDGFGQDIGDIRLQNSRPFSSKGYNFTEFSKTNDKPYIGRGLVLIKDVIAGIVDLPGWDLTCAGNITFNGAVTCNNLTVGFQGSISN